MQLCNFHLKKRRWLCNDAPELVSYHGIDSVWTFKTYFKQLNRLQVNEGILDWYPRSKYYTFCKSDLTKVSPDGVLLTLSAGRFNCWAFSGVTFIKRRYKQQNKWRWVSLLVLESHGRTIKNVCSSVYF